MSFLFSKEGDRGLHTFDLVHDIGCHCLWGTTGLLLMKKGGAGCAGHAATTLMRARSPDGPLPPTAGGPWEKRNEEQTNPRQKKQPSHRTLLPRASKDRFEQKWFEPEWLSSSATKWPALDPGKAVALIVPWPWPVSIRTRRFRDSICLPLLLPTRPVAPRSTITSEFRLVRSPLSGLLKCCSVVVGGSPPGCPISPQQGQQGRDGQMSTVLLFQTGRHYFLPASGCPER